MPELRKAHQFLRVPDTWEGWAMRVMTVAVVMVFVAVWWLAGQINSLSSQLDGMGGYIAESRAQRTAYQVEELARQCTTLSKVGVSVAERRALGC